jgi:hypothetical protein
MSHISKSAPGLCVRVVGECLPFPALRQARSPRRPRRPRAPAGGQHVYLYIAVLGQRAALHLDPHRRRAIPSGVLARLHFAA